MPSNAAFRNTSQEDILQLCRNHGAPWFSESLPALPVGPGNVLHPANPLMQKNYAIVHPASIHELKLLLGVPNQAIDHTKTPVKRHSYLPQHLPKLASFNYGNLSDEEKQAVDAASAEVLFNYYDEAANEGSHLQAIAEHLLQRHARTPVLVADNLDVPTGTVYPVNTPTAVFNTITVHGTGQIQLLASCKFTAQVVQYLAN